MIRLLLVLPLLAPAFLCAFASAENSDTWNGKRAAIALTYDDSLNVHLDHVVPDLAEYDLKATFYVAISFPPFPARLEEWRQVAAAGHELGNHTLFHPCSAKLPGREWVTTDRDLSTWPAARILENIRVGNTTLQALDGKQERTFAYPCGDRMARDGSYVEPLKSDFVAARGVQGGLETQEGMDLFDIRAHFVNGDSAERLTGLVDDAIANGALLVFLFHGVGGEHPLDVSRENHATLLKHLNAKADQLWVAPLVDIARFVRSQRAP